MQRVDRRGHAGQAVVLHRDQLGRILIRWISRYGPEVVLCDPPHVVRVVLPAIELDGLLDTAFEQIRHDAVAEAVVSVGCCASWTRRRPQHR